MNNLEVQDERQKNAKKELIEIFSNIGWLLSDKLLKLSLGLIVSIWLARYLGSEKFGILSYVTAFVTLFSFLSSLGLDGIVVREMALDREKSSEILGSAFILKLIGSLILIVLVIPIIMVIKPNQPMFWTMASLIAAGFLLKPFECIGLWFRAEIKSRYSVIAQNIAFSIASGFRLLGILFGAGLIFFAFSLTVEALLGAIGLLVAYGLSGGKPLKWLPTIARSRMLIQESWPLIFSGFFVTIYLQIDQIMLGQMLGDHAVGLYSAAVRISTVWYFIPMAIGWSVQSTVVKAKKENPTTYLTLLQDLFTLMAVAGYMLSIPVFMFSEWITRILLGVGYMGAAEILSVHIFASLFVFSGVARGIWVTTESMMKFSMVSNMIAAVLNVFLNIVLIKTHGTIGAAYATLASYFITYIASGFFYTKARKVFYMQIKALFLYGIYRLIQKGRYYLGLRRISTEK